MEAIEVAMPGTSEWLEARKTGLGGSEICAAAGDLLPPEYQSKYSTAYEVAARKLGLLPEFQGNEFTRRGKRAEKFVLDTFLEEHESMAGVGIARYPMPMLRHPEFPFIFATPDALLTNDEGVEVKTSNVFAARGWLEEGTDKIPADAFCQAQMECELLDVEVVHVPLMLNIWTPKVYVVRRNQRIIDVLIEAAAALWEKIVMGDLPEPQFSHPSTFELMKRIHGEIEPGTIVPLSERAKEAASRRQEIAAEAKKLKAEDYEMNAILAHEIGDNAAGDLEDGYVIRRSKQVREDHWVSGSSWIELRRVKRETFEKG